MSTRPVPPPPSSSSSSSAPSSGNASTIRNYLRSQSPLGYSVAQQYNQIQSGNSTPGPGTSGLDNMPLPTFMDGLICPICQEEMLTLTQLNRHIDDAHSEQLNDESTKNVLLEFFQKAQKSFLNPLSKAAKKTESSLSNLNFESINSTVKGDGYTLNPNPTLGEDEDEVDRLINRSHWLPEYASEVCMLEGCGKTLGLRNGKHNCRRCGRLYCETHAGFQMRLTLDAQHDPVRGYWARVCQVCFVTQDGYNDTYGVSRNRTQTYLRIRKGRIDKVLLEANKLEKRLEKLANAYASMKGASGSDAAGSKASTSTTVSARRALEQSLVKWEDDNEVTNCYACGNSFNSLTNRKHHCRLCGRIVCVNDSSHVPLYPVAYTVEDELKNREQAPLGEVRMCNDCKRVVFRRRDAMVDLAFVPPYMELYQAMSKYRAMIDDIQPKFNSLLVTMSQRRNLTADHPEYVAASRYRKSLLDHFAAMDHLGKRLKSLKTTTVYQQRVHSNIHLAMMQYLQSKMFTLHLMPNVTTGTNNKGSKAHAAPPSTSKNGMGGKGRVETAAEARTSRMLRTSAHEMSEEEMMLLEQLEVLEMQRGQVEGQVVEATRRRRLEDAQSLRENLRELDDEIERIRVRLGS
ncbi:FYVE zinc finger-domain-containing protein [Cladochytrium replicatum]|nr:FYVE zinc finger-domain-containing protein [Cladochytrium replicatum]